MVFTGGVEIIYDVKDIYDEKNYEVFGRGLKNCMDVDLLGGMGYVGGDWKKVWMWMD
jgi:hypothetical protein